MNMYLKLGALCLLSFNCVHKASATVIDDVTYGYGLPKGTPTKIVTYEAKYNEYGKMERGDQVGAMYFSNGRLDSLRTGKESTVIEYGDVTKMTLGNEGASMVFFVNKDSTKVFRYSPTQEVVSKDLSPNDEHGNPTSTVVYNEKGEVTASGSYSYVYDEEGRVLEKKTYNTKGETVNTLTRKYSSNGVLILQRNVDGEGNLKSIFRYNQQGDIVERCDYAKGKIYRKLFKYKYDENGNWIQRQFIKNNLDRTDTVYEVREITY